jgi:hypothetical protein
MEFPARLFFSLGSLRIPVHEMNTKTGPLRLTPLHLNMRSSSDEGETPSVVTFLYLENLRSKSRKFQEILTNPLPVMCRLLLAEK